MFGKAQPETVLNIFCLSNDMREHRRYMNFNSLGVNNTLWAHLMAGPLFVHNNRQMFATILLDLGGLKQIV